MDRANEFRPYCRIPITGLEDGMLAALGGEECKTLLAVALHWRSAEWSARPTVRRLQNLTGFARSTIFRHLRALREIGAIEARGQGGGRGNATTYGPGNGIVGGTVSGPACGTVSAVNGPACGTPHPISPIKDIAAEGPGARRNLPGAARSAAARGTGSPDPENAARLRCMLVGAAIADPKLSALCRLAGLTPRVARRVIDTGKATGKGPGAIIRNLEAAATANLAQLQSEARRATVDADRRAREARTASNTAEANAREIERLRALDADALADLRARAIAAAPPAMRRIMANGDPFGGGNLNAAMIRLMMAEPQQVGG